MLTELKQDLGKLASPTQAAILQRFFKTGQGEYGEGDIFLGIKVPEQRKIARKHKHLSLNEVQKLLDSKIHEHRLVALFILVDKYMHSKQTKDEKEVIDLYLKNTKNINNWDLVDLSAPKILGDYLLDKDKCVLYKLARSDNLWEKRISILSTYTFIRTSQFEDALKISEILIKDKHDLIHKAVGWMLREIGNRNLAMEEKFLKQHYQVMPRAMLRYAVEKFPEEKRQFYLQKKNLQINKKTSIIKKS